MKLYNNDSLMIIKTQVIRGISDHDAVFVEGINIKVTLNKQNEGWCIEGWYIEKQTGMP